MPDGKKREVQKQVKDARKGLAAMAATYCLGIFDDNYFKEAAMLLALTAGHVTLQGYASIVITVPRVLLAAVAGWASDRFPKRRVVIGTKLLELAAAVCGAVGVLLVNWYLIFAMLGMMGLQAALFSPAINGSIPELYPASYVPRVNALMKAVTTAAILAGVALAGVTLDVPGTLLDIPMGRVTVAIIIVATAAGGAIFSFGVPSGPAAAPRTPFPWSGPWNTLTTLREVWRDRILATALLVNAYFWSIGAVQMMVINMMGKSKTAGILAAHHTMKSNTITGLMITAQLVGIAFGGVVAGRLVRGGRWYRSLWPSMVALGLFMMAAEVVPYLPQSAKLPVLFSLLGGTGIAGGFLLVPTDSFMQVRTVPEKRGAVIASSGFASYAGIILASFIANFLNTHVRPTTGFALGGVLTLTVGVGIFFVTRLFDARHPGSVEGISRKIDGLPAKEL